MVDVRVSRVVGETLGDEPITAGVSRVDVDVAADRGASTGEARVTRVVGEVLGDEPITAGVSRVDVDVAADRGPTSAGTAVSRVVGEVLGSLLRQAAVSRVDVDVAGTKGSGVVAALVSRVVGEVLAPQGSAGPVAPLALNSDAHIFLHNWVSKAEVTTSYLNSVSRSPATGAQSRRGLSLKPVRKVRLVWQVCPDEDAPSLDLSDLERLEKLLVRMGDEPFQIPLYPDQRDLGVAYTSLDDTVLVDTTQARLFVGARVVIVEPDSRGNADSFTFHTIQSKTTGSLTFDAPLGVDTSANALLYPLIDCEVELEVSARYETARVPQVSLTVSEVPGASALPPSASDTPSGPGVTVADDGRPVWPYEPDWSRGIRKGRKRDGEKMRGGRAPFVIKNATRSRQFHELSFTGERSTHMWPIFEFWDSRRGRQRSFWHTDQDQYLQLTQIEGTFDFIRILQIGDLADFSEEFTHVGLLTTDGTMYVREVLNIAPISGDYRLTLASALPNTLAIEDVVRVARARITTFEKDEFKEVWTTRGLGATKLTFLEALDEADYPV